MEWLTEKCGVVCYAQDEVRMTISWKNRPELEPIVWILRHDFSGRSWYHPTHGPHKEAMLDGRCHVLTAGHLHQWGALTTEQRHESFTHAITFTEDKDICIPSAHQTNGQVCVLHTSSHS